MEMVSQFLGRFHPLVIHLPIGFLILAFIFECLALTHKYNKLKVAVPPALLLGGLFAIVACITGYFLKQEGGYEDRLVDVHQYLGIATAVLAMALYFWRKRLKTFYIHPNKRKQARVIFFVPLILLLVFTGHWGASLTHGEDFLSLEMITDGDEINPVEKIKAIGNLDTAVMYQHVIQPLLEANCYGCHSTKKQKGELRLDLAEFIKRGGKHGDILIPGLADSSTLYRRLMLPLEDEHHMPPNEKPQPSSTEIAIIQSWIDGGASFDKKIADFSNASRINSYVKSYVANATHETWIPENEIGEADQKTVEDLKSAGVLVVPVSATNNYLMINFINARSLNKKVINALQKIKNNIVWLNLGYSTLSNDQLKDIGKLTDLRLLFLNNTEISDEGTVHLNNLKELRYLNLVGTAVTDKTLTILKALDNLKTVYLYQTQVTSQGVGAFLDPSKKVMIDTGSYSLETLPTDTLIYKRKIKT